MKNSMKKIGRKVLEGKGQPQSRNATVKIEVRFEEHKIVRDLRFHRFVAHQRESFFHPNH